MRIAEIHVYARALPVVGPAYAMSKTAATSLDSTLVKVVAEGGLVGWGEVCPVPGAHPQHALGAQAALRRMAPALIGLEALEIERVRAAMDGALKGHAYAKAPIDVALWDIAGKRFGLPVATLLGGARTARTPAYYSTTVGAPDETARIAREKAREGYRRLQIKVGGRAVEVDVETLRKVHETVGDAARLIADANCGWTAQETLLFSIGCADLAIAIEQPCESMEELAAIRPSLRHPVLLDESAADLPAVLRAVGSGICDGFGLKVTRAGGLSAMRAIRDVCAARRLPHTCDDSWGGDVAAAACVHLAATVAPALLEGVWIAAPYIEGHDDPENGVRAENGAIAVPTAPGLGVAPDESRFGPPIHSWS